MDNQVINEILATQRITTETLNQLRHYITALLNTVRLLNERVVELECANARKKGGAPMKQ